MFRRGRGLAAGKRQAPVIEVTVAGTTPPPRRKEGTHPGRVAHVRNTETPTESGPFGFGRPTARTAEFSGGNRMPKKPRPAGESRQETAAGMGCSSKQPLWGNWPDTGPCAWVPKGTLTWAGEL